MLMNIIREFLSSTKIYIVAWVLAIRQKRTKLLMDSYRSSDRCRGLIEFIRSVHWHEHNVGRISMVARSLLTVSFSRRIRNIIMRDVYARANRKLSRAYVTSGLSTSLCNVFIHFDIATAKKDRPASGN